MCLELKEDYIKKTKAFIDKCKKDYIIAYKKVLKNELGELEPLYQKTPCYKIGENISSRASKGLTYFEQEYYRVDEGFHVYLNKKDVPMCKYVPSCFPKRNRLLSVKIYLKDIVAVGSFCLDPSLVCMKMTISQKEYDKATDKSAIRRFFKKLNSISFKTF